LSSTLSPIPQLILFIFTRSMVCIIKSIDKTHNHTTRTVFLVRCPIKSRLSWKSQKLILLIIHGLKMTGKIISFKPLNSIRPFCFINSIKLARIMIMRRNLLSSKTSFALKISMTQIMRRGMALRKALFLAPKRFWWWNNSTKS
jgi:hypothetical protein